MNLTTLIEILNNGSYLNATTAPPNVTTPVVLTSAPTENNGIDLVSLYMSFFILFLVVSFGSFLYIISPKKFKNFIKCRAEISNSPV